MWVVPGFSPAPERSRVPGLVRCLGFRVDHRTHRLVERVKNNFVLTERPRQPPFNRVGEWLRTQGLGR